MLLDGVLTATLANVVNVRADKTTSAAILRTLKVGDSLRYSSTTVTGGAYLANGKSLNSWYELDSGFIAAGVVTIGVSEEAPDVPIKDMGAPFVSQLGANANRLNNDCPEACTLMGIHWSHLRSQRQIMRGLTVNMLTRGRADNTVLPTYIEALLNEFGCQAKYVRPLTPDVIMQQMDADRLVIALVNYQYIGGESFGHYAVVNTYGERGFWLHDPYHKGANFYLSRANLDRALSDVGGFATWPYQGVTLL